ncbi:hypothetical protein [Aquibacillus salsiterrae]|uniref:Uncharacterized protein n=1 Tax=Aquibacillus salsiterrae TaxID=2950439 RepID=A0A9X3WHY7_9BACI|nr:hypothetical protein [Aquibacillus salsiterrae]MDC3417376.1 hypothetical protein [Aquibacillus salsiterrae]
MALQQVAIQSSYRNIAKSMGWYKVDCAPVEYQEKMYRFFTEEYYKQ